MAEAVKSLRMLNVLLFNLAITKSLAPSVFCKQQALSKVYDHTPTYSPNHLSYIAVFTHTVYAGCIRMSIACRVKMLPTVCADAHNYEHQIHV